MAWRPTDANGRAIYRMDDYILQHKDRRDYKDVFGSHAKTPDFAKCYTGAWLLEHPSWQHAYQAVRF